MKNGGNKSVAFIVLFSVVISISETFIVLDLIGVRGFEINYKDVFQFLFLPKGQMRLPS